MTDPVIVDAANVVAAVRHDESVQKVESSGKGGVEAVPGKLQLMLLKYASDSSVSSLAAARMRKVIEDQGALVVTDSLCFGSRMLWKDVDEDDGDPITALARFYVAERPSCPRVFGKYEERAAFMREMIRDFQVDGVILERLAFCDLWGFEQFTIKNDFQDWGVPLLMLDREYTLSGVGQLKTRVQAFLETIGEGNHGSEG